MNKRIFVVGTFILLALSMLGLFVSSGSSSIIVSVNSSSFDLINRTMYSDIKGEVGNYTIVKIAPEPINYDDGTGYDPINTTIIDAGGSGEFRYNVEKGIYQSYFKEQSSTSSIKPVKVVKGGYEINLDPESLIFTGQSPFSKNSSTGVIVNNTLTYEDQFYNIDLKYTYKNSRLKEELVINSLSDLISIKPIPLITDDLILNFNVKNYYY